MNTAFCILLVLSVTILSDCSNLAVNPNPSTLESKKSAKLPPCKMCNLLVDSFKKVNKFICYALILHNHFALF